MDEENLKRYLSQRAAQCRAQAEALLRDDRRDEANFEKIRENVYGIFQAVLSAACKASGDEAAQRAFFQSRLAQIPKSWYDALEAAQTHGDETRAYVERIKIETLRDIADAFAHETGEKA